MGDPSYEITRVNNAGTALEEGRAERIVLRVTKFRNNRFPKRPLLHHSRFIVRGSSPCPCVAFFTRSKEKKETEGGEGRKGNDIIPLPISRENFTPFMERQSEGKRREDEREREGERFFCSGNRLKD